MVFSVKLGNFALLSTLAKGEAKDSPILPLLPSPTTKPQQAMTSGRPHGCKPLIFGQRNTTRRMAIHCHDTHVQNPPKNNHL